MAEMIDESTQLESTTVGVSRTSATIKGGRRFSFNALVVVGDRRGRVGIGYGKAKEVPSAIEKAQKDARKRLRRIELQGGTIPHESQGRFLSSRVRLIPASPGTGVVAGATVRAILELAGITDCLTKCYGSTNQQNTVKAALDALEQLRKREQVEALRGVTLGETSVEQMIERGRASMPAAGEKKVPVPQGLKPASRRPRRGGRGGDGGGGGGGGDRGQQQGGGQPASGGGGN